MDERQKQLQRDYAFQLTNLRDVVLCLWEDKSYYPVDTYDVYKSMLDEYVTKIDNIIQEMKERSHGESRV